MEFRILGPLEVLENGRRARVGGAKQRALLAILLLHANEVVSTDRLIDALWEDDAPETGQEGAPGVRLAAAKGARQGADRHPLARISAPSRAGRARSGSRSSACSKTAGRARLWPSGAAPPLADFAYERFANSEIARLEDLRLACLEERIESDLDRGRHAALVGELETLVREHPLRERLRAQLMLALYRSGRQAEALEAYQDARAGARRGARDRAGTVAARAAAGDPPAGSRAGRGEAGEPRARSGRSQPTARDRGRGRPTDSRAPSGRP